jgi:uncharacterized repeat protein (TIGR01451 family)
MLLFATMLVTQVHAQPMPHVPASVVQVPIYNGHYAPPAAAAPLLYVRVAGPEGMRLSLFRNGRKHDFDTPCVIGVRPGYSYRLMLSGMKRLPDLTFYPTLDVYGSLAMGHKFRNLDFPASLVFREEELLRAESGALHQKAIVLERPELANPAASKPEQPLEFTLPASGRLIDEARERGALLALLHFGQRKLSPEEMIAQAVPGTLLMPGERVILPPQAPPAHQWTCYPLTDPILGPEKPSVYCCLPDGGDVRSPATIWGGRLVGLDPSDTVAEYQTSQGVKKVAISNRICLCVPRFIIVKQELFPNVNLAQLNPQSNHGYQFRSLLKADQGPISQHQMLTLELAKERLRASTNHNFQGTLITASAQDVNIRATIRRVQSLDANLVCTKTEPDEPLVIDKWPDKCGALVGDVVTFYLRVRNPGKHPITDVIVSDSLISRFEYVRGTAQADRDAIFTAEPNEEGSSILRWEFRGTLQPGETGLVRFQVRIR